ncbi:tetratricopeptide repeat protein [Oceanicoccus sp. KOV_DT_Chl]|uniref:tetratricopeptide repeat protein n=1 Tax=Oceanicoccus sp. KOV_DT_Chl TaxID=1904639 RepID=UPI001F2DB574|nr:tetratricopeptide repeat protein [Oceanicoccus sp. KOV_DT_Chl]
MLLILASCASAPAPQTADVATEKQATIATDSAEIPSRPFPGDSFHDLLVAEFAVRRSRYDLALGNYLQQAHQTRDPGVTARATRLAQFLNADNATLDAAQLWVELEPDNTEAQYTLATILAENKRPLEALVHMAIVLEQDGKTNFAAIAASALPLPETNRNTMEAEIDRLLVLHPDNTQLMTAKSLLLQQRDETEAALKLIREVLKLDNKDLHAVVVEARLLQQLGREGEAFQRLSVVVKQYPNNRRLRLQYARLLMSKDIVKAKQQFEILLNMAPNDPDLLLSLGLISKETDQLDDAESYFQRLLASGQRTTESYYYLGQLAELNQNWQAAIEYYRLIPPGADFLAASSRITSLYLKQGRQDTAREYLTALRQQYPEHAVRLYLLEAELLMSTRQPQQGFELLTEALLIYPQQGSLLYTRSMFSEQLGDLAAMEQDLREIIAQDADNATALNALGYVLANRTERLDEAFQLISRALAAKPGDPAILDSLGWVEYKRGNLQQALTLLQQAYQAFQDHEVAAHLGEVLWQLGKTEQANALWQQALKKTPNSPILTETINRLTSTPATSLTNE